MLNNVELYYYLSNNKMSADEWNNMCKVISKTNNEHVFKTSRTEINSALNEFLLGDSIIINKDELNRFISLLELGLPLLEDDDIANKAKKEIINSLGKELIEWKSKLM